MKTTGITLAVVALAAAALAGGCKNKDAATTGEPTAADQAPSEGNAVPAPTPAAEPAPRAKTPPPPAERTGQVVYGGKTMLIAGDAFLICETVNPAFEGDFNIHTKLEDGTKFKLMGNVDDFSADHQGLILGSLPNEEKATGLTLKLEGRTLSGTATTKAGPIEFTFEC